MNLQTTILRVAKDSPAHALLADALRKAGLDIREATTGTEALARLAEKPDLILLDVELPDLSGFEVCRRLKVDRSFSEIPVLLMSATFAEEADRLQALAVGADDYLIAPVEPAELLKHIRVLLAVQKGGSTGSSEDGS